MRRREFIKVITGSAVAAWPPLARAQQPATPVIGYLDSRSPEVVAARLRGLRQGLKETGYVEGENVAIAYRWAEDRIDRLPALAADLVRRPRCRDRRRRSPIYVCGQGGNYDDPHRLFGRQRPCATWFGYEPLATRWQHDWN